MKDLLEYLAVGCPLCGASAGVACRTSAGNSPRAIIHRVRIKALEHREAAKVQHLENRAISTAFDPIAEELGQIIKRIERRAIAERSGRR